MEIGELITEMKLSKLALLAAIACGTYAGNVTTAQAIEVQQVACDCDEPICGCEPVAEEGSCDAGCDSSCDGMGCGLGLLDRMGGDLDDPFTLFGSVGPYSVGGWLQLGYHSNSDAGRFNSYADHLQLQQAWIYAERAIDASNGWDIGGRIDYVYGTDGPDTQAFGTGNRGWDNKWDHGSQYGHALPQAYFEVGYGDLSVKLGHFYTNIGYEVVGAPDNFFYSHAYTMYNSEPFTHTGVLATLEASEDVTFMGGYTMGWDSGFDDNGDSWLGGVSLGLTDRLSVTYASVAGRFSEPWAGGGEKGYMQSVVADYAVSDKTNYVFQTDWLNTTDLAGNDARNTYGINQYLIHQYNDRIGAGLRYEWWASKSGQEARAHIHDLTLGVNYRQNANLLFRPEVRWDWAATGEEETTFGIDAILTF
jgi:hypothetical protein